MAFILLIAPRRGENIVDPEGRATRRFTEYLELNAELVNQKRTEIIDLGDWDMNATTDIDVAHGLEANDIISAEVLIRNDANTSKFPIDTGVDATDTTPQGYVGEIDATNVNIVRLTGGKFDHTDYDSTSYNRGWLILTYIND
jgi:hypothetical protein